MSLTPEDLTNISQALEQALQRSGVMPSPPLDLPEQRRLGLRTLCHVARRAAAVLARTNQPRLSADLSMTIEEIEKEWKL